MRIGHGFDVHAFGEGDGVTLGGVSIPHTQGLIAHSDGDVAIHALCDALLGAIGEGDIGRHFPDSDPSYENADSRDLLRRVFAMVKASEFSLANADITIIAQEPKLSPYIETMRLRLSEDLEAHQQQINIKATTTEALGYVGRKEGIAAHAVVLLC